MRRTLPDVTAVRREAGAVALDLYIPADLAYFPDHFPRFAMVPGVVQVDWAIHFSREHLPVAGGFRRVEALKFQQPLLPRARPTLTLSAPGPGELAFRYSAQGQPCSGGRIVFGDG